DLHHLQHRARAHVPGSGLHPQGPREQEPARDGEELREAGEQGLRRMADREDLQSKAADLVKKVLTVGVGAIFLTEESVRALVSEFKLPKELLTGILSTANKTRHEFLSKLSTDIL